MAQACDLCGDSYKTEKNARKSAEEKAKVKADENKKSYAVCEDEINRSFFIADAFEAIKNRFKVVQIVSGLQD